MLREKPLNSRLRISHTSAQKTTKTIVVAGGAGFLGSMLCRVLLAEKHRVICVDNLQTGRLQNIHDLFTNPNFKFMRHDVIVPLELDEKVDQIYNLASAASPCRYQSDPIHTFKTSIFGAMNLLDLAVAKKARILQASTSEVYGDPEISPQPEEYHGNVNTMGPRACYDEGKRAAETVFYEYNHLHGVEIKIARIFNTYGPDMSPDDGRVVSNFIMQAIRGENITVYGDGSQTRSFCYRDDLIAGLVCLMNSPADLVSPVNLGNPGEFTVLELAQLVMKKVGASGKIIFSDLPADDPRQRKPDIRKAAELLGWSPSISLSEGVDLTITHFKMVYEECAAERALRA